MEFIHYTGTRHFRKEFLPKFFKQSSLDKILEQAEHQGISGGYEIRKPTGFWFSVNDEWEKRAIEIEFETYNLTNKYLVTLKENANVLHLEDSEEVLEFHKKYEWDPYGKRLEGENEELKSAISEVMERYPHWKKVKKDFDGMLIYPYESFYSMARFRYNQFKRLFMWYNCWDCGSGVIWNTECIDKIELIESNSNYKLVINKNTGENYVG